MKGIVYYCFKYDQGCLIIGNDIPKKINKACSNYEKCNWEDIGSFIISKRKLKIDLSDDSLFDKSKFGWKREYFKKNIYNSFMDHIDYHEIIDDY